MPGAELTTRPASAEDAPALSQLARVLARDFIAGDCTEDGLEVLLAALSPGAMRGYLHEGCRYWVAENGDRLAGFVAIRGDSHLFHLFVDEKFHRRGVASALLQTALSNLGSESGVRVRGQSHDSDPISVTVNSSTWARPFYERKGFTYQGSVSLNGVTSHRMVLELPRRRRG